MVLSLSSLLSTSTSSSSMIPNHHPSKVHNDCNKISDTDSSLSHLAESILRISETHEVTRFYNNYNSVHDSKTIKGTGGLYSNGLLRMMTGERNYSDNGKEFPAPTLSNTVIAPPSGMLSGWSGDVDWESKRRAEFSQLESSSNNNTANKQRQLRKVIRARRKSVNQQRFKVASLRRQRLRLERLHSKNMKSLESNVPLSQCLRDCSDSPVSSSRGSAVSNKGGLRRRASRFGSGDIAKGRLEWKQKEQNEEQDRDRELRWSRNCSRRRLITSLDNNKDNNRLQLRFLREQKKSQRALLDLQVGLKHMGL